MQTERTANREGRSLYSPESNYRYPDIRQLLPDTSKPATCLTLEPSDSRRLRSLLERVGSQVSVRARSSKYTAAKSLCCECYLRRGWKKWHFPRSRVSGPELVVTVSRNHLLTALQIGLRRFRLESALEPVVATDKNQRFIWLPTRESLSGSTLETVTSHRTASKVSAQRPDHSPRRQKTAA